MNRSKSTFRSTRSLTVGQGDDIGLPRHAGEERHFAEHIARAQRDAATRKDDLGGARGDEIARVPLVAVAHDELAWNGEAGPSSF